MFTFMNWKRWEFVFLHATVATAISYAMQFVFGSGILEGSVTGLLFLVAKEIGEFTGKAKAAGTFVNDFKGNAAEIKDALDDKWQIMQTVGASLISLGLQYMFAH